MTVSARELDTGTADLIADVDVVAPGVGRIVLNRPERRNALSPAMQDALGATLARFDADDRVGAILVTGAGGAFCSGGDVTAFAARAAAGDGPSLAERTDRQLRVHRATVLALHATTTPTVAALPGAAAGAGLGLALACDLRVGCPDTVLATAFARVGLAGDHGTAWSLTRLVGPARARRLMLLGERLDADAALAMGLLDRVVPAPEVATAAAAWAGRLAAGPRVALAGVKAGLLDAETLGLAEAIDREVARHEISRDHPDHAEAVAAFTGRRDPVFGRQ